MRLHIALVLLLLTGCATPPPLQDDTPLPAEKAHVVILPQYRFGKVVPGEVEIELTRILSATERSSIYMPKMPNNQISVLALEPGVYFVSAINSGDRYMRHKSESLESLFEVKRGQINYAGNWRLTGVVRGSWLSGSPADGFSSINYSLSFSVVEDKAVLEELRKTHPKTLARLPLRYTRIDLKNPEAVRQVGAPG
jgi:hypothetical protein